MLMRTSFTLAVAALAFVSCGAESPALRVRSSFVKEDEKLNALEGTNVESGVGQRRELWSWWSMLFLLHEHGPCHEHGPLAHGPHGCHHEQSAGNSSSSSDSSTYSSDSSYVASSSESQEYVNSSANGATAVTGRSLSLWMLVVAGCAATAALAAAAVGSRKEAKEAHMLEGSVKRRITLFSAFADSALCGSASRPDRVVEMTTSGDGGDAPYRLA